jgi:hypothetical protein
VLLAIALAVVAAVAFFWPKRIHGEAPRTDVSHPSPTDKVAAQSSFHPERPPIAAR